MKDLKRGEYPIEFEKVCSGCGEWLFRAGFKGKLVDLLDGKEKDIYYHKVCYQDNGSKKKKEGVLL